MLNEYAKPNNPKTLDQLIKDVDISNFDALLKITTDPKIILEYGIRIGMEIEK